MAAAKPGIFTVFLVLAACRSGGPGPGADTDPDPTSDDDDDDATDDDEGDDGDTDGDTDGATDGDTDGDTDTDGEPACPGRLLDADGSLDLDLQAVQVAGTVRLDGGDLPAEAEGSLSFTETRTGATFALPLAVVDAGGSFRVVLGPGRYEVAYLPSGAACGGPSPMPCTGGVILPDVALNQDGALDLDIGRVEVALSLTQNGAALPDGPRGSLAFEYGEELASVVDLADPPASIYVFPGTHAVRYLGRTDACDEAGMPCGSALLMPDVTLMQDGVLELDVPAIVVNGSITLDGDPMPTSTVDRGTIRFSTEDGSFATVPPLGQTGSTTYEIVLAPNAYDVHYDANPGACHEDPEIPCVGGLVSSQALMDSGTLDVNIATARVHGEVTLNGAAVPDYAVLTFQNESAAGGTEAVLDEAYGITVMKGAYDVVYEGDPTGCANEVPDLPCIRGVVVDGAMLTASGTLDVDIVAVTVGGHVTVEGDALPDEDEDRGSIQFVTDLGLASPEPIGSTGSYDYGIRLVPGTYDVMFTGNPNLCLGDEPAAVPCLGGVVNAGVSISADGTLDIDLPRIEIRGGVTLEGDALPDEAGPRGHIEFASPDGAVVLQTTPFDVAGPVTYAASLFPAHYIVRHAANPELCLAGPTPSVPCGPQVLLGCEDE